MYICIRFVSVYDITYATICTCIFAIYSIVALFSFCRKE